MVGLCKKLIEASWFQNFIILVILAAGVVVGFETYPSIVATWGPTLHIANQIILWIFILEIAAKMIALGNKPWNFFKDPWNVFDFIIVAASLLPIGGEAVTVLRLARLLRVLRLVRALPSLQILVSALLKSIPSMGYVGIFLFLLFYIYAVAGVFLFAANDPFHFRDLQNAFVTLFGVVTLEGWTDIMYTAMFGCQAYPVEGGACEHPHVMPIGAAAYFISFVLLGTMIILNLFIGVIMNGMEEAKAEQEEERMKTMLTGPDLKDEFYQLGVQIKAVEERVKRIKHLTKS